MSKGMPDSARSILNWILVIGIAAFILLIMVVIFGNLSGNVGFTDSTQGYNDSQNIILNYTTSAVNTAAQFPTVGTIIGIAILLLILIGLLIFVIKKMMGVSTSSGGSSNASFG
jgi:beta-lactamase regulating signal transducer with metallopeptidase domain